MKTALEHRLATAARLKWRLTKNFARRRPFEVAAIAFVVLAVVGILLTVVIVTFAALLSLEISCRLALNIWLWSLFILLGFASPIVASIDLTQLLIFPLKPGHLFGVAMVDMATGPHAAVMAFLMFPLALIFWTGASNFLVFILVFCLFALFILCWLRLSLTLLKYFTIFRILRITASVGLILLFVAFYAFAEYVTGTMTREEFLGLPLVQVFEQNLPVVKQCWTAIAGILQYAPPGMATEAYLSAVYGNYGYYLLYLSILAGEAGLCMWLAFTMTARLYRGELSQTEGPALRRRRSAWERFRSRKQPAGMERPLPFVDLAFAQLVRKEWLYIRRVPSAAVFLLPAAMPWFLIFVLFTLPGDLQGSAAMPALFLIVVYCIAYFCIEPLSMKFGWDAFAVESLLVTPVPRSKILAAKSFALGLPLLVFHLAALLTFSLILHIPTPYVIAGVVLLPGVILLADVNGNLLSVLYPMGIAAAKVRWRLRTTERLGCLSLMLRQLLAFALGLLLLPIAAIMVVALLLGTWLSLAIAGLLTLSYAGLYYCWAFRYSVRLFEQREEEIARRLTTEFK